MKSLRRPFFFYVSPWLFAAAATLLALIVIIFAAGNISRARDLMIEGLISKGLTVSRIVFAGTRAAMMMGSSSPEQLRQLLAEAVKEPDIVYIYLLDGSGNIFAQSDDAAIPAQDPVEIIRQGELDIASWKIINRTDLKFKVFELSSPFKPFGHRMRRNLMHNRNMLSQGEEGAPYPPLIDKYIMYVGLDMSDVEQLESRHLYNIIFMSTILLLVGIGGWLSLLAAQGYRSSQKSLAEAKAFSSLLVSRLPVGVIAVDEEGIVRTVNSFAETLTGHKRNAVLGADSAKVLRPELQNLLRKNTDGDVPLELCWKNASGNEMTIRLSSAPILDQDGNKSGTVLLMHDLTELRRMELEVRRHDRLVSLGKMAGGVAHEVRNPLSSIKGFATLLGSKFNQESEEYQVASMLTREVERLDRSIMELLNFAKPVPLVKTSVSLPELIGDSLRLIEADAKELGIGIDQDTEEGLSPVQADSDRIKQVLLNLYLNAIQAMENGGVLRVTAKRGVNINTMEIVVEDTGSGIPAEIQGKITDPYFTTKPAGTGLGLAIAHKIIEEHGGSLHFDSTPGKGTTVTLALPAAITG